MSIETSKGNPVVRRPDPHKLLRDLTCRLAEEFDDVPLPLVTAAVKSAAGAVGLFGDSVVASMDTIERIAREDLIAIRGSATAA